VALPEIYPAPAFAFSVRVEGCFGPFDAAFREVSGFNVEMQLESVVEGGENRFVHQLPKGVKQGKLTLKRGIIPRSSLLLKWVESTLSGDQIHMIQPRRVEVCLLDAEQNPLRSWSFEKAYPVRWELETLSATKNEVAVERIDLAYQFVARDL